MAPLQQAIAFALTAGAAGHASMIMPPSRSAIDSELPPWSHGQHPPTGIIEPYSCSCTNGSEVECNSGQSCFWFSQGCTIGCAACDGDGRRYPSYDHCPGTPNKPGPDYLDKKYAERSPRTGKARSPHFSPHTSPATGTGAPTRAPSRAPTRTSGSSTRGELRGERRCGTRVAWPAAARSRCMAPPRTTRR